MHINSPLQGSGNSSLLCGMEKIEKKKNTPPPARLNDGVRIIGDHQFSEAENGNVLVKTHQFTPETAAPTATDGATSAKNKQKSMA